MTEPRWLNEREAAAWRGYERMRAELSARLNRNLLRDSGLSSADYAVLVHLSEAPQERARLYELGATLQWEKSRLSHHLTRMERRGLVAREQCDTDARGAFVTLTPEGRTAIEQAAPQHVEDVRRYFIDLLTPAQLDAMAEISDVVHTRLTADDEQTAAS